VAILVTKVRNVGGKKKRKVALVEFGGIWRDATIIVVFNMLYFSRYWQAFGEPNNRHLVLEYPPREQPLKSYLL